MAIERQFVFAGLSIFGVFVFYGFYSGDQTRRGIFVPVSTLVPGEVSRCWPPDPDMIDPRDASVNGFIASYNDHLSCEKSNDTVGSEVDDFGILTIRSRKAADVKCSYKSFARRGDYRIKFGASVKISSKIDLVKKGIEFISVSCKKGSKEIYQRFHAFPSFLDNSIGGESLKNSASPENSRKLNVFFLIIESMSTGNFNRFMNKTKRAIAKRTFANETDFFQLKGLTKVADNSYPNMIPLLTGNAAYSSTIDKNSTSKGPFDKMDIIWKDFRRRGYSTALLEEAPKLTLFNYDAEGFIKQPVDWYPRPFWKLVDSEKRKQKFCYQDTPEVEVLWTQALQFYKRGLREKVPTFTYSFYIKLTHDDFNALQVLDGHLAKFIEDFPSLDKTVLMVMGDHGNRFGGIIKTEIGWIEERMPYFSMFLPKLLTTQFPSISRNLKANEKVLTTWYDVHAMLKDIVNSSFEPLRMNMVNKQQVKKRSYSLWRETVPANRRCEDAAIPETYCVCNKRTEIRVDDDDVQAASLAMVGSINYLLRNNLQDCVELVLNRTQAAKNISSWNPNENNGLTLELLIDAEPSKGEYRAEMTRFVSENSWQLKGDVTRLNAYGNQSHCIHEKPLKPLCFCKN